MSFVSGSPFEQCITDLYEPPLAGLCMALSHRHPADLRLCVAPALACLAELPDRFVVASDVEAETEAKVERSLAPSGTSAVAAVAAPILSPSTALVVADADSPALVELKRGASGRPMKAKVTGSSFVSAIKGCLNFIDSGLLEFSRAALRIQVACGSVSKATATRHEDATSRLLGSLKNAFAYFEREEKEDGAREAAKRASISLPFTYTLVQRDKAVAALEPLFKGFGLDIRRDLAILSVDKVIELSHFLILIRLLEGKKSADISKDNQDRILDTLKQVAGVLPSPDQQIFLDVRARIEDNYEELCRENGLSAEEYQPYRDYLVLLSNLLSTFAFHEAYDKPIFDHEMTASEKGHACKMLSRVVDRLCTALSSFYEAQYAQLKRSISLIFSAESKGIVQRKFKRLGKFEEHRIKINELFDAMRKTALESSGALPQARYDRLREAVLNLERQIGACKKYLREGPKTVSKKGSIESLMQSLGGLALMCTDGLTGIEEDDFSIVTFPDIISDKTGMERVLDYLQLAEGRAELLRSCLDRSLGCLVRMVEPFSTTVAAKKATTSTVSGAKKKKKKKKTPPASTSSESASKVVPAFSSSIKSVLSATSRKVSPHAEFLSTLSSNLDRIHSMRMAMAPTDLVDAAYPKEQLMLHDQRHALSLLIPTFKMILHRNSYADEVALPFRAALSSYAAFRLFRAAEIGMTLDLLRKKPRAEISHVLLQLAEQMDVSWTDASLKALVELNHVGTQYRYGGSTFSESDAPLMASWSQLLAGVSQVCLTTSGDPTATETVDPLLVPSLKAIGSSHELDTGPIVTLPLSTLAAKTLSEARGSLEPTIKALYQFIADIEEGEGETDRSYEHLQALLRHLETIQSVFDAIPRYMHQSFLVVLAEILFISGRQVPELVGQRLAFKAGIPDLRAVEPVNIHELRAVYCVRFGLDRAFSGLVNAAALNALLDDLDVKGGFMNPFAYCGSGCTLTPSMRLLSELTRVSSIAADSEGIWTAATGTPAKHASDAMPALAQQLIQYCSGIAALSKVLVERHVLNGA